MHLSSVVILFRKKHIFLLVHSLVGKFTCIEVHLALQRNINLYLQQLYLPSTLIVTLSFIAFWIDYKSHPARTLLSLLSIVTVTTKAEGTSTNQVLVFLLFPHLLLLLLRLRLVLRFEFETFPLLFYTLARLLLAHCSLTKIYTLDWREFPLLLMIYSSLIMYYSRERESTATYANEESFSLPFDQFTSLMHWFFTPDKIDILGSFTCLLVVLHLKRLFGYYLGECSRLWLPSSTLLRSMPNTVPFLYSSSLYSIDAHCDSLFCFILDRP